MSLNIQPDFKTICAELTAKYPKVPAPGPDPRTKLADLFESNPRPLDPFLAGDKRTFENKVVKLEVESVPATFNLAGVKLTLQKINEYILSNPFPETETGVQFTLFFEDFETAIDKTLLVDALFSRDNLASILQHLPGREIAESKSICRQANEVVEANPAIQLKINQVKLLHEAASTALTIPNSKDRGETLLKIARKQVSVDQVGAQRTIQHAIEAAREIDFEHMNLLREIIKEQVKVDPDAALETTRRIGYDNYKECSLANIATHLIHVDLDRAIAVMHEIKEDHLKMGLLNEIIGKLAETDLHTANRYALTIRDQNCLFQALGEMAVVKAKSDVEKTVGDVLRCPDELIRNLTLAKIAKNEASVDIEKAYEIADKISNHYCRAETIVAIAVIQAKLDLPAVLDKIQEAIIISEGIESPSIRISALTIIADAQTELDKENAAVTIQQALAIADGPLRNHPALELADLALVQAKLDLLDGISTMEKAFQDKSFVDVLLEKAETLTANAGEEIREHFSRTRLAACLIRNERLRKIVVAGVLAERAKTETGFIPALAQARTIPDTKTRAEALRIIASRLV